jgi:hypothetical protein
MGEGKVVNISSAGILFTAARQFAIRENVELLVHWPVKLEHLHRLKLAVLASVVRCEGDEIAVEIRRHEFQLEGAPDLSPRKAVTGAVSGILRSPLNNEGGIR